jgi:hypothetical protein
VVTSTSTSPYIGILRMPARPAAVTILRFEGKGRTSTRRWRAAGCIRVLASAVPSAPIMTTSKLWRHQYWSGCPQQRGAESPVLIAEGPLIPAAGMSLASPIRRGNKTASSCIVAS